MSLVSSHYGLVCFSLSTHREFMELAIYLFADIRQARYVRSTHMSKMPANGNSIIDQALSFAYTFH